MLQLKIFFTLVRNTPLFNIIVMLILLTYPALLLTVRSSMGVLFGVMLIISVAYLYSMRKILSVSHWDGYSIAFALAMASPVVAIFLSQAYHGEFDSPPYDWASRFLLSIPIFLALRQTNIRTLTVMQFGMPLGALIGVIALLVHPAEWGWRSTTSFFFNLIHFSDTALMLGFLSLFSINWERKDHALILILKLCGFLAGIYISVQSGERGGWIAIPPLLLLWVLAHSKEKPGIKFGIATAVIICAIWLSYTKTYVFPSRINAVYSEIINYSLDNKDTSIGIRFQLYQAAIHLFLEHPIFGVGPGGFAQAMPLLSANGILTPAAASAGISEMHNEILAKCVSTGLFGLLSILSIYLVPLFIFWRSSKSTISSIRIAAFMGLCLISGFFIFGLTVEIFNLKMTATFFAFTLAVLMAAAMQHQSPRIVSSPENIESAPHKNTNHASPPIPSKQSHIGH